jgi:hypothetical protein
MTADHNNSSNILVNLYRYSNDEFKLCSGFYRKDLSSLLAPRMVYHVGNT